MLVVALSSAIAIWVTILNVIQGKLDRSATDRIKRHNLNVCAARIRQDRDERSARMIAFCIENQDLARQQMAHRPEEQNYWATAEQHWTERLAYWQNPATN